MSNPNLRRSDLVYPELSYILVGYAYEIFNGLGYGLKEKYYQNAFSLLLKKNNHQFVEQKYYPLYFHGNIIGKSFVDFEVEDKIIILVLRFNKIEKRFRPKYNKILRNFSELSSSVIVLY